MTQINTKSIGFHSDRCKGNAVFKMKDIASDWVNKLFLRLKLSFGPRQWHILKTCLPGTYFFFALLLRKLK